MEPGLFRQPERGSCQLTPDFKQQDAGRNEIMRSGILFSCQRELDEQKVEDMKRTFFCGTLACALLLLNACTFGDIQIETWSEAQRDSAAVNSADSIDSGSDSGSTKTPEAPRHAALGERFYATPHFRFRSTVVPSVTGYDVSNCTCFSAVSLSDAIFDQ